MMADGDGKRPQENNSHQPQKPLLALTGIRRVRRAQENDLPASQPFQADQDESQDHPTLSWYVISCRSPYDQGRRACDSRPGSAEDERAVDSSTNEGF
jgi:hypothetical protein